VAALRFIHGKKPVEGRAWHRRWPRVVYALVVVGLAVATVMVLAIELG